MGPLVARKAMSARKTRRSAMHLAKFRTGALPLHPRRRAARPGHRYRPCLEWLEAWVLPSTYTVTSAADTGTGTLRQMIQNANNNPGPDTILFNIPGSGAHTIALHSALPTLTDPVVIDGTSQPGFAGAPLIQLDGSAAGVNVTGLYVSAAGCTLRGLVISRFGGAGIVLTSANNVIQGDYVGTDLTGKLAAGNGADGIAVFAGAKGNLIGTNGDGVGDAAERNVISGNAHSGVAISGTGTNQNVVAGNLIGTDVTGTAALGAGNDGVAVFAGAQGNRIGVSGADAGAAGEGNVISANHWSGVGISGTGTNQNVVAGNLIGVDVTGAALLGNLNDGVGVFGGAQGTRVGTNADGAGDALERNVISGNSWDGVAISDAGTTGTVVAGNYVGTDKTGTAALGNRLEGVGVANGAASNRIGSNLDGVNDAAEANLISGNWRRGVLVSDAGSNQNAVEGNRIGTDVTGTQALGNAGTGVEIDGPAQGNFVRLNTIYGNGGLGIDLGGDSVTVNDPGDADAGPNNLQNYPVITGATPGPSTTVAGTLSSLANTTFTLDFYASAAPDRSYFGQGQRYLGSASVTTDATGSAPFSFTLAAASGSGEWVTATATDPSGNTSEFSAARPLPTAAPALGPTSWTALGPAPIAATGYAGGQPFSGKIDALAADPTNANVIYVAGATGGVWKTTDGGVTWTPLTDTQATLSTGAIALAPSNPAVIYAGTGETTFSGNSFYGRGVLKSTDGGLTWTLLANSYFDRMAISRIVVDPSDPNTVYVASSAAVVNGAGFGGKNVGVWKSTDGGATWTDTTAAIPNINRTWDDFSALALDPGDPTHQTLYTTVSSPSGNFVGFSAGAGVYKTTNGGGSWTLLGGGMPSGVTVGLTELALSPSAPQTVYASIVGTGQPGSTTSGSLFKMLKSTDGGSTWSQLTGTPDYFHPENQGWFDSTLAVDPSSANVVYAGAGAGPGSFIESTDGGSTWADISLGSPPSPNVFANSAPHADHHGIGFDAHGKLLDGDDGGLFRLDNPTPGSVQWTDLGGNLGITQFTGIALDPTNPGVAYGGSQDNGTERFDGALGWTQLRGGDGGFVRVDPAHPATVYHTYNFGGQADFFERSDNGGSTWAAKTTGINLGDPANFYPPYVIDSSNPVRLLLGTNRVYETTTRGDSWAPISTPGAGGWPAALTNPIDSLAVSASSPNTIYAVERDANGHPHVLVTFDDGASWQERDIPGISSQFVHIAELDVDPTNNLVAYAVRDQFNDPSAAGHVFRTADGGQTWSDISGNLPDLPTYTLAVDPRTGALYAGNDTGVFESCDEGATWFRFGTGLPNVQVVQLQLSTTLGILAAGTHGRGLWEIQNPGTHFRVTPSATAVTAGAAFSLTVTALDGNNNPLTTYTGTVHFTSSDARAALPPDYTFKPGDAGSQTFSGVVLVTAGAQTVTAADTAARATFGTAGVTVNPGAPATLAVTGLPSPTTAGDAHPLTVTAQDAYGNTATGYRGTVHFTSTDPKAVLPANYPFTAADNGAHTFPGVTLKAAGTRTVTATDTQTATLKGHQIVTVNPAAVSKFVVSGFPSSTTAGVAHGFTVKATDAYGNTVPAYAGTVHFTSNDGQAVLPGDYTFLPADKGVHTFPGGATLKTTGSRSIIATDTQNPAVTGKQTVKVTAAAVSKLLVAGFPSSVTHGTAHNFTVTAQDAFGNTVTGYTGTVSITSSDPQANFTPATYTFTTTDKGVHTFSGTLNTTGTQSITATDTAGDTGTEANIQVTSGAAEPWWPADPDEWDGPSDPGEAPRADWLAGEVPSAPVFRSTAGGTVLGEDAPAGQGLDAVVAALAGVLAAVRPTGCPDRRRAVGRDRSW
jgi:hypothetical protein